MPAGDGDLDAGKFFFHRVAHPQHFGHERDAAAGIGGGKFRFQHQQHMATIAAGDAAIHNLPVTETRLQRQNFGDHQPGHADGVGGNDVLQHHALRPGKFSPHHREIFADGAGFKFRGEGFGVGFGEQIRQRARQKTNRLLLSAHVEAIHDARRGDVGCEVRINFVRCRRKRVGIAGRHAHVNINAVDLPELADRIAILVHQLVVLRQRGENVLLQINPR